MCARNQVSLQKVNEIGHGFIYAPSKLAERSKSIAMFAISLQDQVQNFDPDSDFAAEAQEEYYDRNENESEKQNENVKQKREYQPSQIL